ncbi:MAG: hypothetical protein WA730_16465, partial [Pseudolabrys sp.]
AQSGHAELHCTCPLSGVKRTSSGFTCASDMVAKAEDVQAAIAWLTAVQTATGLPPDWSKQIVIRRDRE